VSFRRKKKEDAVAAPKKEVDPKPAASTKKAVAEEKVRITSFRFFNV
jgi:hypothetical protein